ncbi:MAG: ribonuclease R family protein [Chthoniobacterales bacterium]
MAKPLKKSPRPDLSKKRSARSSSPTPRPDRARTGSKKPHRFFESVDRSMSELEVQILCAVEKEPLPLPALKKLLERKKNLGLEKLLERLEKEGLVARIKGNQYIIPKTADLFIGTLQVHANGGAHLISKNDAWPDLYISAENASTGMNRDVVMARLITPPRSPRRDFNKGSRRPEGHVIKIIERANKTLVGTLQQSKDFSYVVADDPRFIHNLYVSGDMLLAKPGDKVVASLDRWENRHNNPEGRILEVLGAANSPEVAMLSIIRKHQLPIEFPEAVLREAAKHGTKVDPAHLQGREDLRNRPIITIDPDDARDFDDAIEVQSTTSGWNISVHIADVAHYVTPHSALDEEARSRGNSVYMVDRVIPMLPENLSNGLCSLRPNEDRLAFSVFADIDRKGTVRHVRFARTVIRSIARLTYKEALALLQSPPKTEIARRVHEAWDCSSLLRQRRFRNGALDLEMPEIKVWLDKKGIPIKLERIENDISHQLIEELMLLTNELVARHLTRSQEPTIYRVHEKPDVEKLNEYRELAASYGVKAGDLNHRKELQKLLDSLHGKPYEHALKIGLLKSLKRARYTPEPLGHYGLQKKDYSHFTSPIRRYADLITHRSLARQIGLTKTGPSSRDLPTISEHISVTERTAGEAEKESVRLKKLDYFEAQQAHPLNTPGCMTIPPFSESLVLKKENALQTKRGVKTNGCQQANKKLRRWKAQVVEARNYGLFVELPEALVSGLISVSTMDDDFYIFDAFRSCLIGQKKKRVYRAGDTIEVVVEKVDRWKQQIDFRIAKK